MERLCRIHGSTYIPAEYQPHLKCIVDQEGLSSDDAPDTTFYQWVTFIMALQVRLQTQTNNSGLSSQAAIFYMPYKIWAALEGGLMAQFGSDGKSLVMVRAEAQYEDGVVMEAVLEKFVKYFKSIFHHNSRYLTYYLICK